jgi:signal transduction histidine kinase
MSAGSIKILLIEDNLAEARLLQEVLKGAKLKQFSLVHVKRLREGLNSLVDDRFDVVLLDLTLPDSQGLDSLKPILHRAPGIPIVVLTNTNDDELAIAAVRQGAQDYLVKRQVNTEVLVRSLMYAIERRRVMETLREVNQALENRILEQTAELIKAKELNQLKSEFVSMISHDFRSPLNSILLSTGLLEERADRLSEERRLTHFQLIHSAIHNMARLLDEISLIAQADSGNLKCKREPLDLEPFCRKLIRELQVNLSDRHQLNFSIQGELPPTLWDETLLRHILSNLLSNAIKYSPDGGVVQFDLIAEAKTVIFRIQDQGIGIPSSEQPELFQPFNRAKNVGTIPGTGLGLAIVKRCVEAYNGTIAVESEVGTGSTFTVILPFLTGELSHQFK